MSETREATRSEWAEAIRVAHDQAIMLRRSIDEKRFDEVTEAEWDSIREATRQLEALIAAFVKKFLT